MKTRADQVVPDPFGVLKSHQAFFRRGVSGAGEALLTEADVQRYRARVRELVTDEELVTWLHQDGAS